jgi:hypothetical protein
MVIITLATNLQGRRRPGGALICGWNGRLARPGRRLADRNGMLQSANVTKLLGLLPSSSFVRRVTGRHRPVACATHFQIRTPPSSLALHDSPAASVLAARPERGLQAAWTCCTRWRNHRPAGLLALKRRKRRAPSVPRLWAMHPPPSSLPIVAKPGTSKQEFEI